jgi:hypothetical protein
LNLDAFNLDGLACKYSGKQYTCGDAALSVDRHSSELESQRELQNPWIAGGSNLHEIVQSHSTPLP